MLYCINIIHDLLPAPPSTIRGVKPGVPNGLSEGTCLAHCNLAAETVRQQQGYKRVLLRLKALPFMHMQRVQATFVQFVKPFKTNGFEKVLGFRVLGSDSPA